MNKLGIAALFLGGASVLVVPNLVHGDDAPAKQPATAPATQPTTSPAAINWDQAIKHVGETVTVTGPVKGTHVTTNNKSIVLNIGKDFPEKDRFSIMVTLEDKQKPDEESYKGKTVTVTGKVELYRNAPEIRAKAADVKIEAAK